MEPRERILLELRDLLEHLSSCRVQLEWSERPETVHMLTERMLRDLERCHGFCHELRRRVEVRLSHVA